MRSFWNRSHLQWIPTIVFVKSNYYKYLWIYDIKLSKWTSWLWVQKRHVSWPDGYNLTSIKWYAVHLGDEDGCHSLVQSSSVHVNGGTNGEHETSDPFVDGQVLFQAAEGDGKGTSAEGCREGDKLGSLSLQTASTWALMDLLSSDLEAVPRAVIQAWKMPRKKVKGFFLTITK